MKSFVRAALVVLFLTFAFAAWVPEATRGIFLITGIFDCCQGEGPAAYCEDNGCWVVKDCTSDQDCRPN